MPRNGERKKRKKAKAYLARRKARSRVTRREARLEEQQDQDLKNNR
jgi:hypothetical protein